MRKGERGGEFGRFASFEMLAVEPAGSNRVHNSWNPSRPSGLHLNSTVEELLLVRTACRRGGRRGGAGERREKKEEIVKGWALEEVGGG